jgi:hypothetical protein
MASAAEAIGRYLTNHSIDEILKYISLLDPTANITSSMILNPTRVLIITIPKNGNIHFESGFIDDFDFRTDYRVMNCGAVISCTRSN